MSEDARPERRLLDAGRGTSTMRWVMAIMLFLTVLAAALGLGAWAASGALDRQLAGRLTVELVEVNPAVRDRDAARVLAMLRGDHNVAAASPVDRVRLARLLEPWLGAIGDDPDLPMPALIDVDVRDAGVLRNTTARSLARNLAGRTFGRPRRHGKWLILPTDGPALLVHSGMTGRPYYVVRDDDTKHVRLVVELDRGEFRYADLRKLRGVWLLFSEDDINEVTGEQGPDALRLDLRSPHTDILPCSCLRFVALLLRAELLAFLLLVLLDLGLLLTGVTPRESLGTPCIGQGHALLFGGAALSEG